ncbi:MAG: NACHT domain-containing protein [Mucilaginibacter sp.]
MTDHITSLTLKLQNIPENQLTREIIIPLLKTLGFDKAEFFGGPSEEGKDIVFWGKDRFDDNKLYVAQVKHFRFTNTAADERGLQTIVNQLTQCFSRKLPYTDLTTHFPSEVQLITSYPVDTKTLMTRFNDYSQLKEQQIKIIDGVKLAELIIKHQPEKLKDLLGIDFEINTKTQPFLNNRILLSALGSTEDKDLKAIHTDIDFSLGKISTTLFFNSVFHPSKRVLELEVNEIRHFRKLLNLIKDEYKPTFIKERAGIDDLLDLHTEEELESDQKADELKKELDTLNAEYNRLRSIYENKKAELSSMRKQSLNSYTMPKLERLSQETSDAHHESMTAEKKLINIRSEYDLFTKKRVGTLHKLELDGKNLAEQLKTNREWIENNVTKFNTQNSSSVDLREFFIRCQSIFESSAIIFKNPKYFQCIGIEDQKSYRNNFESTRFKLPIDQIFDTGLNLTVLGEAGAGKTTSLQMYFSKRQQTTEKLILWLPLARVIQTAQPIGQMSKTQPTVVEFERMIFNHLVRIDISIKWEEFILQIKSREVIFLFDGIDEAIKPAPWLTKAINAIADKYKENAQVIATCRMSGAYLEEIPFFAVTLLPFTHEQRDRFIELWFADESQPATIERIKSHLEKHKAVAEIITNPLLATTLCVLAKHQLPLPRTEINLYTNRIKLLTGQYDLSKNITSRVSVTPQTLETLAQKLAFFMHSNNLKEEFVPVLESKIRLITKNVMDSKIAITALNDLIDPCNLLVPMSEDGKFGFGHLRYQEHLAAMELVSNRGIDIIPLLKNEWWRGVLVLFARMVDNLFWLIKEVGEKEQCGIHGGMLKVLIDARPKDEQGNLIVMFQKYQLLENGDAFRDNDFINHDDIFN